MTDLTVRTTVAAITLGVITVAGLSGATAALSSDSSSHGDLALPDRLGDKVAIDTAAGLPADIGSDRSDQVIADLHSVYDYNNEQMAKVYDAQVVTRRYVEPEQARGTQYIVTLIETEVDLPAPIAFDDPDLARLAAPQNQVVDEGDVQCLLERNQPPAAGQAPDTASMAPDRITCQRVGSGITLRVFASLEPDLTATVAATNDLFAGVS